MIAMGTITYAVTIVLLIGQGVAWFDHEEGLLDPSVGGWLAWCGLGILFLLPSLAFLAPLAYASRRHVRHAAATAAGIGVGLMSVGLIARALASPEQPRMIALHETAWQGAASETPVTLTLDAGKQYYVLTDFRVIDRLDEPPVADLVVRGPGNGNVAVHRSEGGFVAFPSPERSPRPPSEHRPASESLVIGEFVAVETGPHEVSVGGNDHVYVTAGPPEWRQSWESDPFVRETIPLYGITILVLGMLGFVARTRGRSETSKGEARTNVRPH